MLFRMRYHEYLNKKKKENYKANKKETGKKKKKGYGRN